MSFDPNNPSDGERHVRFGGFSGHLPPMSPARYAAERAEGTRRILQESQGGNYGGSNGGTADGSMSPASTTIVSVFLAALLAGEAWVIYYFGFKQYDSNAANPPAATSGANGIAIPQNASDSLQTPPPLQLQAPQDQIQTTANNAIVKEPPSWRNPEVSAAGVAFVIIEDAGFKNLMSAYQEDRGLLFSDVVVPLRELDAQRLKSGTRYTIDYVGQRSSADDQILVTNSEKIYGLLVTIKDGPYAGSHALIDANEYRKQYDPGFRYPVDEDDVAAVRPAPSTTVSAGDTPQP